MNTHKFFLLLLLSLIYFTSSIVSQSSSSSEGSDDIETIEREFSVEVNPSEVRIDGKGKTRANGQTAEDEIDIRIKTDDGSLFESEFKYEAQAGNLNENTFEFKFRLVSVIEFEDNNPANGVWDGESNEPSIFTYDNGEANWNDWTSSQQTVSGAQVYNFEAVTTDDVMTVSAHISSMETDAGGSIFDPNSLKIDFAITNFPYVATNKSKLALITRFESEYELEGNGTDYKVADGEFNGFFGTLSWVDFVEITNSGSGNANIKTEVGDNQGDQNGNSYRLVFTIDDDTHGDYSWDPSVGVTQTGEDGNTATSLFSWISMYL